MFSLRVFMLSLCIIENAYGESPPPLASCNCGQFFAVLGLKLDVVFAVVAASRTGFWMKVGLNFNRFLMILRVSGNFV